MILLSGTIKSSESTTVSTRNSNLDLLRVLACIAVVSLHTIGRQFGPINSAIFYLSGFAVPVFFMASGYMLLQKESIAAGYIFKKVVAIFRLVCLWNIVIWLIRETVSLLLYSDFKLDLFVLLDNGIKGFIQRGDFWHFWFLGALILVYLCLPCILKVAQRGRLKQVWFISAIIGVFLQIASMYLGFPVQEKVIQTFRLWTWVQYFVLGGLLGRHEFFHHFIKKNSSLHIHAVVLAGWSLLIVAYQYFGGRYVIHNTYAEYFYDSVVTIIWNILLFTFGLRLHLGAKLKAMITFAAPLTMTIYIVHPFVMLFSKPFVSVSTWLEAIYYFVAVLFVSFVAAIAISKLPFAKYLSKL